MTRRLWLLTAIALGACARPEPAAEVTVAAAASLRGVLPELTKAYQARHPEARIAATYGASGSLKKQVEGGAPVDAVVFAASRPVDELAAEHLVDPSSRRLLASNVLVLVGPDGGRPPMPPGPAGPRAPGGKPPAARPLTFATLDALAPGERVAIGDPGAVPAGDYARTWLTSLGEWEALQSHLVLGGDVAAVLTYARRGEVAAAIVYRTEARGVDDVVVLDEARGPAAPRPEVVGAVVSGGKSATEAATFLAFVAAPEGQRILADFGFGPP